MLAAASLPVSGNKGELVARLLAAEPATDSASAEEEQLKPVEEAAPAVAEETTAAPAAAKEAAPAETAAPAPTPAAPVELTAEEKAERASVEEAKRQARSARFGAQAPAAEAKEEGKGDDELKKRAERFGLAAAEGDKKGAEDKVRFVLRSL